MKTYLRTWLGACAVLGVCVALVNLTVDPYGFFMLITVKGFNAIKPHAETHSGMVKPYLIEKMRPGSILLGDSRVEVGFDPESAAWPDDAGLVLNLGLPGTGTYGHLRFVQNAVGNQRLKYVLMGVHFNDFLVSDKPAGEKDGELPKGERGLRINRDGTPNRDYWRLRLEDLSATLLSFDALVHSLLTISAQGKRYSAHLTPLGFNPMLNYEGEANAAGYYYLFRVWQMSHVGAYAAAPKNIFQPGTQTSENFEVLREIIQLSRADGVHLHLIIYPYHAQMLELTGAAGLWALFEQWKRELTRIVEEETKNHPGSSTARLWDFSDYTVLTTETVPPRGDRQTKMRWYWEAGHFKKELGDLILRRIFNFRDPAQRVPNEFGIELTSGNIDNHLAGIRHRRSVYQKANRASIAEIEELLRPHLRRQGARH